MIIIIIIIINSINNTNDLFAVLYKHMGPQERMVEV